ncbi:MAG: hypothetical protein AAGB04_19520 [Pseudomonadota bacterium]
MKPITEFTTHTGEKVSGQRLTEALNKVADDIADLGRRMRQADDYASHVSESEKDKELAEDLQHAEDVRNGFVRSLSTAQQLNTELTGECIAMLP